MLPRTVLISPLWAIIRYGCASSQLGNVLVEKREWTRANAVSVRSSAQVWEVAAQLGRGQHSLVDDRARREARHDRVGATLELEAAPDHVELALEGVLVVGGGSSGGDDELAHDGDGDRGGATDVRGVDRDVTPGDDALALFLDERDELLLELAAAAGVGRQEAHRDAVAAGRGKPVSDHGPEERVWEPHQDAGTVAGIGIGALGAAVRQVLEGLRVPVSTVSC